MHRIVKMRIKTMPVSLLMILILSAGFLLDCSREESGSDSEASPKAIWTPDTARSAGPTDASRLGGGFEQSREASELDATGQALPGMVDLGKGKCIPCKMMAPILKELKQEYDGRAIIEVIDLTEHPEAAGEYGIRLIPTQIFFDSHGEEVWRHEGFLPKDAIVAKLVELGVKPIDD